MTATVIETPEAAAFDKIIDFRLGPIRNRAVRQAGTTFVPGAFPDETYSNCLFIEPWENAKLAKADIGSEAMLAGSRDTWCLASPSIDLAAIRFAISDIAKLGVDVPNSDEVYGYLKEFPELCGALKSLVENTQKEFGLDGRIILELYKDPEINHEYLCITVRMPEYPDDLTDRFGKIMAAEADALSNSDGYILVTTDFARE